MWRGVGWEELHVVWDRAGPLAVCDSAQVILYQLKGPAKSQGHCGFDESSCDLHALVTAVRLCNGKLIDQAQLTGASVQNIIAYHHLNTNSSIY